MCVGKGKEGAFWGRVCVCVCVCVCFLAEKPGGEGLGRGGNNK